MPHAWALEKEESGKALELLEIALAIDPAYPLALALAGWCHAQRSVYNWADDIVDSQTQARSLAERAANLSGDDALILTVLGAVNTFVRSYGTARVLLERALSLDPNCAWAWSRLGWIENYSDRPQNALQHFERALRLSPIDPMNFNNYAGMGSAHQVAEDYDKAGVLPARFAGTPTCYLDLSEFSVGAGGRWSCRRREGSICRNDAKLSRVDGFKI